MFFHMYKNQLKLVVEAFQEDVYVRNRPTGAYKKGHIRELNHSGIDW